VSTVVVALLLGLLASPFQAAVATEVRTGPPFSEAELIARLGEHRTAIRIGREGLAGPGGEAILEAAVPAQFVALGEEHNSRAIPHFTVALFRSLNARHGFDHLALEEGPALGRLVSEAVRSPDPDAVPALGRRYPNAFHMFSVEELWMMAEVGEISAVADPIWGLNQEFGAAHVFARLAEIAPDVAARDVARELLARAMEYEGERFARNVHYLAAVATPADFVRLRDAFRPAAGSEAEALIDQTELSARIYAPYGAKTRPPGGAFHASAVAREQNMKTLLGQHLRPAAGAPGGPPRVLVKSGHFHLYRGRSTRTEVYTLGNFLSELSAFFGRESLHLYVVTDEPWLREGWPRPFALAAEAGAQLPGDGLLFDLRPLAAWARGAELHAEVRRLLLGYDFFVFLRDGEGASVEGLLGPGGRWYPEEE
jgi:hypothetical protein